MVGRLLYFNITRLIYHMQFKYFPNLCLNQGCYIFKLQVIRSNILIPNWDKAYSCLRIQTSISRHFVIQIEQGVRLEHDLSLVFVSFNSIKIIFKSIISSNCSTTCEIVWLKQLLKISMVIILMHHYYSLTMMQPSKFQPIPHCIKEQNISKLIPMI